MNLRTSYTRVLCLNAAAKRFQIPERTLRYQASRGRIQGAFKQGKLWKFLLPAVATVQRLPPHTLALIVAAACLVFPATAANFPKAAPAVTLPGPKGAAADSSRHRC